MPYKIFYFILVCSLVRVAEACPQDSSNFAKAMCRSTQYNKCFGISSSECEQKAELPFAYCYKAFGLTHRLEKSLKPISMTLKSSGVKSSPTDPYYCFEIVEDVAKCAEAVFYYSNENSLVKKGECEKLMPDETKRWSADIKKFALIVKSSNKF